MEQNHRTDWDLGKEMIQKKVGRITFINALFEERVQISPTPSSFVGGRKNL